MQSRGPLHRVGFSWSLRACPNIRLKMTRLSKFGRNRQVWPGKASRFKLFLIFKLLKFRSPPCESNWWVRQCVWNTAVHMGCVVRRLGFQRMKHIGIGYDLPLFIRAADPKVVFDSIDVVTSCELTWSLHMIRICQMSLWFGRGLAFLYTWEATTS